MYYENQKPKKKTSIALAICLILIIFLLITLNIKFDAGNYSSQTNYETQKLSIQSSEDETLEINVEEKIEKASEAIVGISKLKQNGTSIFLSDSETSLGLGSGVIVTEDGYIVTNEHVAGSKYSNCYVTLENGENYSGRVVWADSNIDIAIVKITSAKLNYLSLGDSDSLHLAEDVYAIGNPVGFEFQRTVTKGIVSRIKQNNKN
jgi:S1-C subfamily serine protease